MYPHFQGGYRGFESRWGHHRIYEPGILTEPGFLLPRAGIRTRQGAKLRKREAFSSVARKARSAAANADSRSEYADIPLGAPEKPQVGGAEASDLF